MLRYFGKYAKRVSVTEPEESDFPDKSQRDGIGGEASVDVAIGGDTSVTSRRSRIFLRGRPLSCEVPSRRDSVVGGGSSRISPWSPVVDAIICGGGGGSSRILSWSPVVDAIICGGGGVVAEFFRGLPKSA